MLHFTCANLLYIYIIIFFPAPLNNKGKAIAYEDTSMETHYIDAAHAIPNAFTSDNENQRINQNDLPNQLIYNASVASCSQGKRSQLLDKLIMCAFIQ